MISDAQCRAARALLDWTQVDLGNLVSISPPSIRAFEKGGVMRLSNQKLLRLAFERAGIQFIGDNGVLLRKVSFDLRRAKRDAEQEDTR
jgi:DNA-binding XRE family transcriptional regulator